MSEALQRYMVWTDHYVTDDEGEWVYADDAEAELKAKDDLARSQQNIIDAYEKSLTAIREALGGLSEFDDHELVIDEIKLKNALLATQAERIAELEGVRNECERQYQEKVAEIIRLLNRIEELERDLGALRASTSYSMRMQVESHCEQVEAERDAALLRLGSVLDVLEQTLGSVPNEPGHFAIRAVAESCLKAERAVEDQWRSNCMGRKGSGMDEDPCQECDADNPKPAPAVEGRVPESAAQDFRASFEVMPEAEKERIRNVEFSDVEINGPCGWDEPDRGP